MLIAKRYSLEAVGSRWHEILSRFVGKPTRAAAAMPRTQAERRLLFLIEGATDVETLGPVIVKAKESGATVMVIVTAKAGAGSPETLQFLIRNAIIPTFASPEDLEGSDARWLRDADTVFLTAQAAGPACRTAQALSALARRYRVAVRTVPSEAPSESSQREIRLAK